MKIHDLEYSMKKKDIEIEDWRRKYDNLEEMKMGSRGRAVVDFEEKIVEVR